MSNVMCLIKTIFFKSTLIMSSCLCSFILIELFLRYENKSKPVERIFIEIYGQNYPFLKSNSTTNPLKIKQNERDLLILGDSFAEGVVCAQDNTNFPSHLCQKINGKLNVINLGIGGLNNADYVDFIDHFNISNNDIVLVTLYDNDIHISQRNCKQIRRQAEKFEIYVPNFCSNNSSYIDKSNASIIQKINNSIKRFKTVQFIKESMSRMPLFENYFYRNEYRKRWNDFESEENKWLRSSLRVMKKQIINKGGDAVFTYYPNTNRISSRDERHQRWIRFIEYVNKHDGIEITDPYPYFIKNASKVSMVWSLTDKHPNCAAHDLMAEFTFNNLKIEDE